MLVEVTERPELSRFEVYADGELAGFADYHRAGDRMSFTHTETEPALTGRGLATALIRTALDAARERGAGVLPFCSFVRDFIERNPGYLDLVPESERPHFDL
jgi:uncharacterized protein